MPSLKKKVDMIFNEFFLFFKCEIFETSESLGRQQEVARKRVVKIKAKHFVVIIYK